MTIGIKFSVSDEARAEIAKFIRIEADIQESHQNIHRSSKREKEKCIAMANFARRLAKQIETGEL